MLVLFGAASGTTSSMVYDALLSISGRTAQPGNKQPILALEQLLHYRLRCVSGTPFGSSYAPNGAGRISGLELRCGAG